MESLTITFGAGSGSMMTVAASTLQKRMYKLLVRREALSATLADD